MIDKRSITWSISQMRNKLDKDWVILNPIYQRGYVWPGGEMKEDLILSVLERYSIGLILLREKPSPKSLSSSTDCIWEVIDGQQRLKSISDFLNDSFSLSDCASTELVQKFKPAFVQSAETNSKIKVIIEKYKRKEPILLKFSTLPDSLKTRILDYDLSIEILKGLSETDTKIYFKRVQNQMALKAGEIINALPSNRLTKQFKNITDIPHLENILKKKLRYTDKRFEFLKIIANVAGIFENKLSLGCGDKEIIGYVSEGKISRGYSGELKTKLANIDKFLRRIGSERYSISIGGKQNLKILLMYIAEYYPSVSFTGTWVNTVNKVMSKSKEIQRARKKGEEPSISDPRHITESYDNFLELRSRKHKLSKVKRVLSSLNEIMEYESKQIQEMGKKRVSEKIANSQKIKLLERYEYLCALCDKRLLLTNMHVDHIIPKSKGGKDKISNYQPLCPRCNKKKSAKLFPK